MNIQLTVEGKERKRKKRKKKQRVCVAVIDLCQWRIKKDGKKKKWQRQGQDRRETREEDATAAQHGPLSVGRPPASLHDAPRQGGSGRGPVRLLKIKASNPLACGGNKGRVSWMASNLNCQKNGKRLFFFFLFYSLRNKKRKGYGCCCYCRPTRCFFSGRRSRGVRQELFNEIKTQKKGAVEAVGGERI